MKKQVLLLLLFVLLFVSAPVFAEDTMYPPRNLRAAVVKGNAVSLKWEPAAGEFNGYLIKRADDGSNYAPISFTQASVSEFTDTSVEKGKTYKYMIYARGKDNKESAPSNPVEVKVAQSSQKSDSGEEKKTSKSSKTSKSQKSSDGSIPVPGEVSVEYNAKDKCVVIKWKHDYDKKIEGFRIYRSEAVESETGKGKEAEGSDQFKKIATLEQLDEKEYKDTKVKEGATYYYYVEAFVGKKKSDRSQLSLITVGEKGMNGDTYLGFCVRENTFPVLSINFKDGSVYMAAYSVPRSVWEMWMPFGTVSAPPNYEAGKVQVDASICDSQLGTMYTIYCYNEKAKTLYVTLKKNETGSWENWKAVTAVDLTNPLSEKNVRVGFSWSQKTHWMSAWDVKNGVLRVQAIASDDGVQLGQWNNPPHVETPPNYTADSYTGIGSLKTGRNIYSYLFCFNPNDLTLYISSNIMAGYNWEPYKVLSNKTLPLPPNMKK